MDFYSNFSRSRALEEMYEVLQIDANKLKLTMEEEMVLYYMYCYIFITNRECRREIGFGKTKSAQIFKRLVELGLVDRRGNGAGTYYILK